MWKFDLPGVITAVGMIVNLLWSVLNLKIQATIRSTMVQEFCGRAECEGKHRLYDERHAEVCRRLESAGA
jgi:hypothetical protein